jgi:hypothetical protein
MTIRIDPDSNYRGIFTSDGVTLRYKLDEAKEFKPLKHPELLDVSLGTKCFGNCPYCYTSAITNGKNYSNVVDKINRFFGPLGKINRPFQVAIGGGGEPTLHPEFCEVLRTFKALGIMPNYTTNGMHLTDKILDATKAYCGGVAVSTHSHLPWGKAAEKLLAKKIRTNLHIIVGEANSSALVEACYKIFPDVETLVLLPYQAAGRAGEVNQETLHVEWRKCVDFVMANNHDRFAFGALFYPFMLENPELFTEVNIYEPEMFSGYLMLDDNPVIRRSSYDLRERIV